jgi:ABC-type nickel/cobalt efflux system permease component RcnA
MKKSLFIVLLGIATVTIFSCGNNTEPKTHTHDDGSTHAEHDTTKPKQEEFIIGDTTHKDTTEHTHKDGKKHSH